MLPKVPVLNSKAKLYVFDAHFKDGFYLEGIVTNVSPIRGYFTVRSGRFVARFLGIDREAQIGDTLSAIYLGEVKTK